MFQRPTRLRAGSAALRQHLRLVVAGDARAATEDQGAALGGGAVKCDEFRVEVAARLRLRHEMVMAILAAHERGTILAGELRHVSREIADGKADAPVVRRAGSRACPREGGGPALAKAGDGMLPSDFFRRNVVLSFQEDAIGICLRDVIGVDNTMWARIIRTASRRSPIAQDPGGDPGGRAGRRAGQACPGPRSGDRRRQHRPRVQF